MNENSYFTGYKTFENLTRVISVYPENGVLFSTKGDFEIINMIAASGGEYIDVSLDIVPDQFAINGIYPNPFNPIANIDYVVPSESHLSVRIYDIIGNEVDVLVDDVQLAGHYKIQWNAEQFSSGVYFIRFELLGQSKVQKMVLMK